MLERKSARPGDILQACQKSHICVSNRDAFEIIVIRSQKIEKVLATVPIEYHLPVAGCFDHDRLIGRAADSQVIRSIEWRPIGGFVGVKPAVMSAVVFIHTGMHQNDVPLLDTRRKSICVIGVIGTHIVGGQKPCKRRRLSRPFVSIRIHVIHMAAVGGLRFRAGACRNHHASWSFDAVGIG